MFQTLVTIEHLTGMTALCNGTLKSEVSEGLGFFYSECWEYNLHLQSTCGEASGKILIVL